jgi:alkanesulfonate monooxygenase SsuD/methylene tetrahydromethanopterin reductase-like flavin-dependent oxidoreductase (luciferase family)
VLLTGTTPPALDLIARQADGWMPVGLPPDRMGTGWDDLGRRALAHGRDAGGLALVADVAVTISSQPLDDRRPAYSGSVDQVIDDLEALRRLGVEETVLDVGGDVTLDDRLAVYAALADTTASV